MDVLRSLRILLGPLDPRRAVALVLALEAANAVTAVLLGVAGVHDVVRFALPAAIVAPVVPVLEHRAAAAAQR